jgi:acyl-CoA synthetase
MTDHDLSTSAELAAIRKSRTELRERWYREGWFRKESLAEAILRRAASQPPTELLLQTTEGLRRTDTAEILADGRRLAHGLREIGIRPGDTVAIQMPTRYEAAIIYMACLFAGATLLPIVHIYGPAEVSFILRRARARAIFVPDRWRKFDFLERMEEIGPLPDLEHVIVVGERIGRGMMDFRNLQARSTEILPPPPQDPDAPCLLMFTSGTTGEPKGVIQTHNTLRYEYETPFIELPGLFLNPAPAGHVQGFNFLMRPFFTGVPVLMMDGWDADLAAQLIAKYKPVQSGGAPYFLLTLLEAAKRGGWDISSLRSFGMGAAAVTPEHVYLAERNGIPAGRSYAMTEHSTVSAFKTTMPLERRATTDGKLQPNIEIRIVDDNDHDLPFGQDGELLLRGPEQFPGYLDPAHDLAAFTADGWLRTGDIARFDDEGYLTITDRKKDLIIRGGENIASMEVENVMLGLPQVVEVAVVAMPDEKLGERVCAYVVPKPGTQLTLEQVIAHCAHAGFAKQKTPERVVLVEEMPRTPSGKVKKAELRARLRAQSNQS